MGFPWKTMTAVAAASAYVLSYHAPSGWPSLSLWLNFALAGAVELVALGVWTVFLHPKFFSALRGLPEPKDNHWLHGQFPRISKDPTGAPMVDW